MMSQSDETLSQIKKATPSKVCFADEVRPSTAPSAPITSSTQGTDISNVTTTSSDDLYTDTFNLALSKIFSCTLMASPTSKDAIHKDVQDCLNTGNENCCRQISSYIHSYWKDLHVKNGCVCVDNRIAIPNSIKYAYVEAVHSTHPGSWGMTDMAVHAWLPFMHRDLLSKTAKCNTCVKIGKNLKSILHSSKWTPLKLCQIPHEEIQIDLGGPIFKEKIQEVYFLACIDRFSNFRTAKVFDRAKPQNILKFLRDYVLLHGIPRTIRLDQAQCQISQQIKAFCNQNNIQLIEAPIHDHRAIGLVEKLIQTIKSRLACIRTAARNNFKLQASINSVIYQPRIYRQKTFNISPYEANFGRKANTPLKNISYEPDPYTLTYKPI